jgi:hypothetical protein
MFEFESIQQLWKTHLSRPFPSALTGQEVDGEDLVLIDSSAAGCISTFLVSGGVHQLDPRRMQVLSDCLRSLSRICPQLPDEHRVYFDTLREISERVIGFCQGDRLSRDESDAV